mmetsp:Transcript_121750/g.378994  ORF Transcript_121750/g.378994 Transcript_121750/m.378994 type:complete len:280 (-) Transcript_121750:173-1012(-)
MPPVSHEVAGGCLVLDTGLHVRLVNLLSGESQAVAEGAELTFDADDWGMLRWAAREPRWGKEVLQVSCHSHDQRGIYLHDRASGTTTWLQEFRSRGQPRFPVLILDGRSITMSVHAFELPRGGAAFVWDLRIIQEWCKQRDEKQQEAARWREQRRAWREQRAAPAASGATAGSAAQPPAATGPAAKRRRTLWPVPKDAALKEWEKVLPQPQATLFHSTTEDRIRVFYIVKGRRQSTSASVSGYTRQGALTWCIQWAWRLHETTTGERCPHPGVMEAAAL